MNRFKITPSEWKRIHDQHQGQGLKVLNRLYIEQEKANHPQIREVYGDSYFEYKKNTYKDNGANALTKSIIKYIELRGYQAERISSSGRVVGKVRTETNVVGITHRVGSIKFIPGTSRNGTADISATICGRAVKIEVKYGKDRQRPGQKEYEAEVKAAGGIYWIARDFQSFYEWCNGLIEYLAQPVYEQ